MPDDRKTTNEPPIAPGLARDDEAAEERGIDTERHADDASPHRDEAIGGVSGAPEAAGRAGPSGGMGASGAMGGAGAGGPIDSRSDRTVDGDDATAGVDPGDVRTEFEMGYEGDPEETSKI
jgi:hypothetical protein